jgi:hypothetical protein
MKLLIDCNEVFDVLTRGPFPSGDDHDEAVEHHLRSCHDCRQLAEALRPAVELFHECLSEHEAAELPEYHGEVVPLDRPLFRALPRNLAEVRFDPEASERVLGTASYAAKRAEANSSRSALLVQGLIGMALTAAIVLTVISLGASVRNMQRPPGVERSIAMQPVLSGSEAARRLLSLQLPANCFMEKLRDSATTSHSIEQQIALAWEQRSLDCCTKCHGANSAILKSPLLVATLMNNCAICHKG